MCTRDRDALDTCETQSPQRRQTLESGASFSTERDDDAGSNPLSLNGEHQTWSKDTQVTFFFARPLIGRASSENNFVVQRTRFMTVTCSLLA